MADDPRASGDGQPTGPQFSAPLPAHQLTRPADLGDLVFESTADLPSLTGLVGQDRARDAVRFGTDIAVRGFNIFAIGSPTGRIQQAVHSLLEAAARDRPAPADWVYVNNFAAPHRPTALTLPTGRAPALRQEMRHLIDDLKVAIPAVFDSEDYQRRRGAIEEALRGQSEKAFSALGEMAHAKNLVIVRTPTGFSVAPAGTGLAGTGPAGTGPAGSGPAHNSQVMPPEEFNALPAAAQHDIQQAMREIERELELTLRAVPRLEKTHRDAVRALNRETAQNAIAQQIEEAKAVFVDLPHVLAWLETVRADLVENAPLFIASAAPGEEAAQVMAQLQGLLDRYDVNILVSQECMMAIVPVVEELHATLGNLLGRVEYVSMQGALVTNFRLIKPGALHRANGGMILIDARSLLAEPFSWPALKRSLVRQTIEIEDASRMLGLTTTMSLEPDPIPLNVKIVLFGDRNLYYLLAQLDPDFAQHFKVLADFDDDMARSPATESAAARLIGALCARHALRPLDRGGVARVIEHAARLAGDAGKLTLLVDQLHELLAEAGHWAGKAGRAVTTREDVQAAVDQQAYRAGRIHAQHKESILRNIALVQTTGSAVGQINGLSVFQLGGYSFGSPTRITCRVRPGGGKVVDIEREVELGGPLHSKGMLILTGFLAGRYALDVPMSLYASLVFEQSYGGVDGDSASSAELYALLSALSELALRQDLAVTGSVNQHGIVQAIGGVNEKIEGYFDICRDRGLTGTQGVLIPVANTQHLMLRADVVAACAAGQFAIYPITTIDQGIALLTGRAAGARGPDGGFPDTSVNRAVEDRLRQYARARGGLEKPLGKGE